LVAQQAGLSGRAFQLFYKIYAGLSIAFGEKGIYFIDLAKVVSYNRGKGGSP